MSIILTARMIMFGVRVLGGVMVGTRRVGGEMFCFMSNVPVSVLTLILIAISTSPPLQ